MRQKIRFFNAAVALCTTLFVTFGGVILKTATNESALLVADTYYPQAIANGKFSLIINQGETENARIIIYIDSQQNAIYTKSIKDISTDIDTTRYLILDFNILCEFIDKCNGALYTENDDNEHILFGKDLRRYFDMGGDVPSKIVASLLRKMLSTAYFNQLEENFIWLLGNSEGNISYIQWCQYKDVLRNIGQEHKILNAPYDSTTDFITKE